MRVTGWLRPCLLNSFQCCSFSSQHLIFQVGESLHACGWSNTLMWMPQPLQSRSGWAGGLHFDIWCDPVLHSNSSSLAASIMVWFHETDVALQKTGHQIPAASLCSLVSPGCENVGWQVVFSRIQELVESDLNWESSLNSTVLTIFFIIILVRFVVHQAREERCLYVCSTCTQSGN